jgi:putative ABC transport system permease protein
MLKNYLKIAWRNLLKHKSFSLINILGLAIGIAACMIIFLYVQHELNYDQYNTKADRIARVTSTIIAPESDVVLATTPIPLADALTREYPEVESTVRLDESPQTIKLRNDPFLENDCYAADQSIFSIFSFDFLEGSAKNALQNPGSIVITKTIAKKYFGEEPALGKTLICNEKNMLVTAVVKDRPANSDMKINALISADFPKKIPWMEDFPVYTFILFKQKPDLKNFEQKLVALSTKYIKPEMAALGDDVNYKVHFDLESLANVHFSQGKLADRPKGNKQLSYVFSLLAAFILIIALLNYINLSTAKSTERAKEVGIRKVSGAMPFQLIRQFLFESFLLIAIAWLLGIIIVEISLPFFNKLLQTTLAINWAHGILFTGSIFLVTLVLAGLYPAFVLSGFSPVKVLKGNWRHSGKGVLLRKTVTITQFAIAAALIMGTTVIYNQMKFIEKKDLGFNKISF